MCAQQALESEKVKKLMKNKKRTGVRSPDLYQKSYIFLLKSQIKNKSDFFGLKWYCYCIRFNTKKQCCCIQEDPIYSLVAQRRSSASYIRETIEPILSRQKQILVSNCYVKTNWNQNSESELFGKSKEKSPLKYQVTVRTT